jgi:hypothetical protein
MSFENEFDLSNVTLKELQDIQCVIREELGQIKLSMRSQKVSSTDDIYKKNVQLRRYSDFIDKAIQIKIIDEMNKTYFGTKITLKNKLPQAEVVEESVLAAGGVRLSVVGKYFGQEEHVEYEPLFPVIPP